MLRSALFPAARVLKLVLAAVCFISAAVAQSGGLAKLTEANFVKVIQKHSRAVVVFVAPWCNACGDALSELARAKSVLSVAFVDLLLAQCDVSRELNLAARYRVARTPVLMMFPDTRALSYGLQLMYSGPLLHAPITQFLFDHEKLIPARANSLTELHEELKKCHAFGVRGVFVAFLGGPEIDGPLQDLWPLECARRWPRVVVIADPSRYEASEQLWRWAGLRWDASGWSHQEGIVSISLSVEVLALSSSSSSYPFLSPFIEGEMNSDDAMGSWDGSIALARYLAPEVLHTSMEGLGAWRVHVDSFCSWCERQVLRPVALFDSLRAASLDNTFEWLLLLFDPRRGTGAVAAPPIRKQQAHADALAIARDEAEEEVSRWLPFEYERSRLVRFMADASLADPRYSSLLPVVVPEGIGLLNDDVDALRLSMGLQSGDIGWQAMDASVAKEIDNSSGLAHHCFSSSCTSSASLDNVASSRSLTAKPWETVLFNTKTRLKYLLSENGNDGWLPGNESGLRWFSDAALDGRFVRPHIRSTSVASGRGSRVALHRKVSEITGIDVQEEVLDVVAARETDVLLLFYAPWCGHSVNFFKTWYSLADAVVSGSGPNPSRLNSLQVDGKQLPLARELRLVQIDGSKNEHPSLPTIARFPTIVLCKAEVPSKFEGISSLRFVQYEGGGSLGTITEWLLKHTAIHSEFLKATA